MMTPRKIFEEVKPAALFTLNDPCGIEIELSMQRLLKSYFLVDGTSSTVERSASTCRGSGGVELRICSRTVSRTFPYDFIGIKRNAN